MAATHIRVKMHAKKGDFGRFYFVFARTQRNCGRFLVQERGVLPILRGIFSASRPLAEEVCIDLFSELEVGVVDAMIKIRMSDRAYI